MVKLVLTGIWVCAITLASVYFSVKLATAPAPPADNSKQSQLELVKGETITVPIIGDGAVTGYFLGRVSFMMNKDTVKGMTLPLTEMTTDELFTLLVGNKMVDISKLKSFDPQAFRDAIKKGMNEKLGGEYVSRGHAGAARLPFQGRRESQRLRPTEENGRSGQDHRAPAT